MTCHQSLQARARRRKQLETINTEKIDAICDPPIATAQAILKLPPEKISCTLRGTTGKYLSETMASMSGYRHAPIRKMRSLLLKLCQPGCLYTWAPLPPLGIDEQAIELAKEAIGLMPYLRGHEATLLAQKILVLFDRTFTLLPPPAEKQMRILARFVPNYVPPPDINAHALMKMPPVGHA